MNSSSTGKNTTENDCDGVDSSAELAAERAFSAQLVAKVKQQAADLEERSMLLEEAAAAAEAAEAALAQHQGGVGDSHQHHYGVGGGGNGRGDDGGGSYHASASQVAHRRLDMRGVPSHVISVIAAHKQATLEAEAQLRKATKRLDEAERRERSCRTEKLDAQRNAERRQRECAAARTQLDHLQDALAASEGRNRELAEYISKLEGKLLTGAAPSQARAKVAALREQLRASRGDADALERRLDASEAERVRLERRVATLESDAMESSAALRKSPVRRKAGGGARGAAEGLEINKSMRGDALPPRPSSARRSHGGTSSRIAPGGFASRSYAGVSGIGERGVAASKAAASSVGGHSKMAADLAEAEADKAALLEYVAALEAGGATPLVLEGGSVAQAKRTNHDFDVASAVLASPPRPTSQHSQQPTPQQQQQQQHQHRRDQMSMMAPPASVGLISPGETPLARPDFRDGGRGQGHHHQYPLQPRALAPSMAAMTDETAGLTAADTAMHKSDQSALDEMTRLKAELVRERAAREDAEMRAQQRNTTAHVPAFAAMHGSYYDASPSAAGAHTGSVAGVYVPSPMHGQGVGGVGAGDSHVHYDSDDGLTPSKKPSRIAELKQRLGMKRAQLAARSRGPLTPSSALLRGAAARAAAAAAATMGSDSDSDSESSEDDAGGAADTDQGAQETQRRLEMEV